MLVKKRTSIVNEITVDKLIYGGAGLARLDGKVVLAPYVLPGERVRVTPLQETSSMLRARLLEIVTSSPERIAPGCPHFTRCGGCHYQHASYRCQLEQKEAILREVLQRVGRIEPPQFRTLSGPPWGYRNRVQFHIVDGRIGYHQSQSHRLCPVEQCPVASPRISEALDALRRMIRQPRFPQFIRHLEVFTDEDQIQVNVLETTGPRVARTFFEWCAAQIPGRHVSTLDYRTAGEVYRVGHRSFFQVNRFLIDQLVEVALEGAEGDSAIDLYAGVGLFSIPMARRFGHVRAVEPASSAASDLEFNAGNAGLELAVCRSDAESFLASCESPPDFVLADPPRAGLGKATVGHLLRLKPRRVTLVSCDPSTLARDLSGLLGAGYRMEAATLIDLFPQTCHIETVVRLGLTM